MDDEVVVHVVVAGREAGSIDDSLEFGGPARLREDLGVHVPVASDDPGPCDAPDELHEHVEEAHVAVREAFHRPWVDGDEGAASFD